MEIGVTTNEIVALEQFGLILDKYGIHVWEYRVDLAGAVGAQTESVSFVINDTNLTNATPLRRAYIDTHVYTDRQTDNPHCMQLEGHSRSANLQ